MTNILWEKNVESSGELAGRVVFIAGVGPQMASATARIAIREGASGILAARSNTEPLAAELRAAGGTAVAMTCDPTDKPSLREAVERGSAVPATRQSRSHRLTEIPLIALPKPETTMPIEAASQEIPSVDALIAKARKRTGLQDIGDPARNVGLEVFVESMGKEVWPTMTPRARELAVDYLVHQLEIRLRLIEDRARHAQIRQQKIESPLIVVGPPRSGSTLLHKLISLDPDNRALEHWMCREPSPPLAAGPASSERLALADKRMNDLFALMPDVFVTHPYMIEEGTGALAECGSDVLSIVTTSQQMWCFWGGDIYKQYLLEGDHTAALGFHHDFLQHLQWGNSGERWALKGSDHMLWMGELAAQYPDAKLIWNHRDLAQQLASLASVQSILLGLRGHPVTAEQRKAQGARAIELQRASVEKAMRSRKAIGDDRFIDVSYHDVMADPVQTIGRLYETCGLKMSNLHAQNIRDWTAAHQQTKHGVHKHSPDEFGMTGDDINEKFAPYTDKFGFGFGIRPELTV